MEGNDEIPESYKINEFLNFLNLKEKSQIHIILKPWRVRKKTHASSPSTSGKTLPFTKLRTHIQQQETGCA